SVSRVGFLCDVATSAFYPLSLHDALPILCLTVVGIPFGIQCFKLAMLGLMPFGRRIVERPAATGCLATLMNIIWLLVGGLELAVLHLVFGLLLALTVVGLPFARQHAKLASLCLVPFGKTVP